jgi:hypothetical protein
MISSVLSVVRRHPIITFFVLTYAIGWGLIPFWTFQAGSPFIAALIVIPLTRGWAGLKELGLRMIRWRGLRAGQLDLRRRVERRGDRVGRLRPEGVAGARGSRDDDAPTGDAAQSSGTGDACLERSLCRA